MVKLNYADRKQSPHNIYVKSPKNTRTTSTKRNPSFNKLINSSMSYFVNLRHRLYIYCHLLGSELSGRVIAS